MIRLTLSLIALSAPASAATIMPVEIILTDLGFRQVSDCSEAMRGVVWRDGHYWSVRPEWQCKDVPYQSGKMPPALAAAFPGELIDAPAVAYTTAPTTAATPTKTAAAPPYSPPWHSLPNAPRYPEPPVTTPPSPVPLPASGLMLIAAMCGLFWRRLI